MPVIRPISTIQYVPPAGGDLSALIAPPYDVLDEGAKATLLARSEHNIVAVDLPHLPPKTVGPDEVYVQAGQRLRRWLDVQVLRRRPEPAMFVYGQTYQALGRTHQRLGLFANVRVQELGQKPADGGGIYPHEQTFSEPKLDRLKLMRATAAQLSPIFGLVPDTQRRMVELLKQISSARPADCHAVTRNDQVRHELWAVSDHATLATLADLLRDADTFIADGHHRYGTAVTYRAELQDAAQKPLPVDHPANYCLFVLVALQDPGLIVLPTHRVLGGMPGFSAAAFTAACQGKLKLTPVEGRSVAELEKMLPGHGPHAMGLYCRGPARAVAMIATTLADDPLAASHPQASMAWRQLDVAIVQHVLVEQVCQVRFAGEGGVKWKFPHELAPLQQLVDGGDYQLGVIVQPTPLGSIAAVCQANELMPQKSTFFYPKLATGLVINPLW